MTYDDFIQLVVDPNTLTEEHREPLKTLMEEYPYMEIVKWLYLKLLQKNNSLYFEKELRKTALYSRNRRNLFFFINPDTSAGTTKVTKERVDSAGSYFDMLDKLDSQGENTPGALQTLAEKLKAAREILTSEEEDDDSEISIDEECVIPNVIEENQADCERLEEKSKILIRSGNYKEAVLILEHLCLINPKKSIYFADQIRFLRKIIKI